MSASRKGSRCLALGALALVAGSALAQQNIQVFVNGDRVAFRDVTPQSVNGRVLVPVRGVLEQLGAYVDYDAAADLVTATRGDLDIRVRIGDRVASVDGQQVVLDVPAQVVRGRTMVPLRFMSEALGAEVRWDPQQYAVLINTGVTYGQPPVAGQPPVTGQPPATNYPSTISITSFDVDQQGWLEPGSQVRFTLRGSPGGEASVMIPGEDREIPLRETNPGVYTGSWTVPREVDRAMNASRLTAVARLRFGQNERLIQSSSNFSVDTRAPELTSLTPNPNSRITTPRPNISAVFDDVAGSGVDTRSVRVLIDGRDVTSQATITPNFVTWRPANELSSGVHEVEIIARDLAGNEVRRSWEFRVDARTTDVIQSFDVSGFENAQPGDVITFTLRAEPDGRATFSIGNVVTNRPMEEIRSGVYEGTYTLRRGDNLQNLPVTARFVSTSGAVYSVQSDRQLPSTGGLIEAPRITQPSDNQTVSTPLIVRGRTTPNSRVQLRIEYATTVAGALRMTGTVAEVVVDSDAQGRFETSPIRLDTLVSGRDTRYTITAHTLGANGQRSDAATITVRR